MSRVVWMVATGVAVLLLVLLLAGWRPVVLVSESMAPGAPAGSLLVTRPVEPEQVAVGDVLTVPLPAGDGRVTHRVVALDDQDGTVWIRLQGDANAAPDAGRVRLDDRVLRTVAVVPGLGRVVGGGNPVLIAGIVLLLVGTLGLAMVERRSRAEQAEEASRREPRLPTGTGGLDTRTLALFATLEALAEDGMDLHTVEALGRARIGALLGLGAVEDSDEVAPLDDGARFVVIALADADADALALVPAGSRRATEARDAVTDWWLRQSDLVPSAVHQELHDVLTTPLGEAAGQDDDGGGGIAPTGPVD